MTIDRSLLWTVIALLAVGTYLIRFSFLGLLGTTPLPGWLRRAMRYTAVAILPGLVAPAVLWPAATGGAPDPARLTAALATIVVGIATRSMLAGIAGGGVTLAAMLALPG